MIFKVYSFLCTLAVPIFYFILQYRLWNKKENPKRLLERMGKASSPRPDGTLFWIHAASIGESQSALIFMHKILDECPHAHLLITTGTKSSAEFLSGRLPERAFHQFIPLDCPIWIHRFFDHWRPDMAFWMESELWPNLIFALKARSIPSYLINARLSQRSYKRWSSFPKLISNMLSAFDIIFTQNNDYKEYFTNLGHQNVVTTGDLKFNALPLPYSEKDYDTLRACIGERPVWVYASTHAGEEILACETHKILQSQHPDILTIIVPRHPERRDEIYSDCQNYNLNICFRGDDKVMPKQQTDIYIADTFGELGLFYRLCPISMIGRSFSDDGGGGHNPIEAAQLGSVVLSGQYVQHQKGLFSGMLDANAVYILANKSDLAPALLQFFDNPDFMQSSQTQAQKYLKQQGQALACIMDVLQKPLEKLCD